MLNLLMLRFKIIKSRITKNYSKKDIILISSVLIVFYFLYIFLVDKIFLHFNIGNVAASNFNFILIINLFLLMVISIPLKVYKSYFQDKKFEILFLSPLKLIKCFSYQLIVPIIKLVFLINILILPFIIICNIKFNFSILSNILNLSIYISIIYIILTFLVFAIYLIINIEKLKLILLFFTGIEEVIYFIVVMTISSRINLNIIFNNNLESNYLGFFNYFNKSMLSSQLNILPVLFNLTIALILFILTYLLFKNIYYKKGFFNQPDNKIERLNTTSNFIKKRYFLKKDVKLLLRDIERLKFIIITIIIFLINLFKHSENTGNLFMQVLLQLIIITFVIQLTFENIFIEKNKKDILSLSSISTYTFFHEKNIYSIVLSSFCVSIYNLLMLLVLDIEFTKFLLNIFYSNFFIIVLSKLCTLIGVLVFRIKNYTLQKILKIIFCGVISFLYYLLVIIQILIVPALIKNVSLKILLTTILMFINNIGINKIIRNILTNKGLLITI